MRVDEVPEYLRPVVERVRKVSERMNSSRWFEFWYAVRREGFGYPITPTLFEVLWYPFLSLFFNRRWHHEAGPSVSSMWSNWRREHFPRELRQQLETTRELWRKARRENFQLRSELERLKKERLNV